MMTRTLTAATCMSLFLGASAFAADNPKNAMSLVDQKVAAMTPPANSQQFAMKAAEGGMFEVKLSQMAQQKGQSDQVKRLAAMVEKDHTQANTELMALAKTKNIMLPTELPSEKQSTLEAFSKLEGVAFDHSYLLLNIKEHLHDVMAFRKEAMDGTDPDVKAWAAKTLPALQQHTAHIGQVARAEKIPVDQLVGGNLGAGSGTDTAVPASGRIQGTNDSAPTTPSGTNGAAGTNVTPRR